MNNICLNGTGKCQCFQAATPSGLYVLRNWFAIILLPLRGWGDDMIIEDKQLNNLVKIQRGYNAVLIVNFP